MTFTVYILQSESTGKYYVGHTGDIDKRLVQHNTGQSKSTRHGIPWRMIHTVTFSSRSEAMAHEMKIKNRGITRYLKST
jgi:putative endonuclease